MSRSFKFPGYWIFFYLQLVNPDWKIALAPKKRATSSDFPSCSMGLTVLFIASSAIDHEFLLDEIQCLSFVLGALRDNCLMSTICLRFNLVLTSFIKFSFICSLFLIIFMLWISVKVPSFLNLEIASTQQLLFSNKVDIFRFIVAKSDDKISTVCNAFCEFAYAMHTISMQRLRAGLSDSYNLQTTKIRVIKLFIRMSAIGWPYLRYVTPTHLFQ